MDMDSCARASRKSQSHRDTTWQEATARALTGTASMSCGARAKRVRARLSLAERVARLASGDQVAGC
jgi:hypothetical protein